MDFIECPVRIVVVGSRHVGKTTLCQRMYRSLNNTIVDRIDCSSPSGECRAKLLFIRNHSRTAVLVDTPGDVSFCKTIIPQFARADIVLLVVSAIQRECNAGFHLDYSTREFALLAHAHGVRNFIVCLTKFDDQSVAWSLRQFEMISSEILRFFEQFNDSECKLHDIIPLGGDENILDVSVSTPWFEGKSLIQTIVQIPVATHNVDSPTFIAIQETFQSRGGDEIAIATIVNGTIKVGQTLVTASNESIQIESLQVHQHSVECASSGFTVGMTYKFLSLLQKRRFLGGTMLSNDQSMLPMIHELVVYMVIVSRKIERIIAGKFEATLFMQISHASCRIASIDAIIDVHDGNKVYESTITQVHAGQFCRARLTLKSPICHLPAYNTFSLRCMNTTVAVGRVATYLTVK